MIIKCYVEVKKTAMSSSISNTLPIRIFYDVTVDKNAINLKMKLFADCEALQADWLCSNEARWLREKILIKYKIKMFCRVYGRGWHACSVNAVNYACRSLPDNLQKQFLVLFLKSFKLKFIRVRFYLYFIEEILEPVEGSIMYCFSYFCGNRLF